MFFIALTANHSSDHLRTILTFFSHFYGNTQLYITTKQTNRKEEIKLLANLCVASTCT